MPIRFKCPHCKKTLGVKDELAGRKAKCPACKQAIVIPAPVATPDVEELAASVLGDPPPKEEPKVPLSSRTIKFSCTYCDNEMEVAFSEAGTKIPCTECRRIVRVPVPDEEKPKDWRQVMQKGPSGALINQPEQPADAWSSEQKKKVSQQALLEAGVIQIPDDEKPIGVRGWIQRGIWTAVVVGIGILVVTNVSHSVTNKREKDAIEDFLMPLQGKGKQAPTVVLHPLWDAEIHRVAGELYGNRLKVDKARGEFKIAMMRAEQAATAKDASPVDADLFLVDLAVSQTALGGSEKEALEKERLEWQYVIADLGRTLGTIRTLEARMLAMRKVGTRLLARNDTTLAAMAIGLAGQLSDPKDQVGRPSMKAPQVALMLARNDVKQAEKVVPPPNVAKGQVDYLPRIAYAEGLARQGNLDEALKVATAAGPPKDRVDACVAVATALLADADRPDTVEKSGRFVKPALEIAASKGVKLPPWTLFQLLQAAQKTEGSEPKELTQQLDYHFLAHANLERIRRKIEKQDGFVASIEEDDATKENLPRALAWEALARHNARLGYRDNCLRLLNDGDKLKMVLLAGIALGEQDKRK